MDPFDLDAQELTRQQQETRSAIVRKVEAEDIKWLMSGPRGRRIVFRWLHRSGIWASSFTGNSETFFREGRREMGLWLWTLLQVECLEEYGLMIQEAKADERNLYNRFDERGTT